jgi:hypothetical protein
MDLQALSKQGKVSLLTLPRTEFKSTQNGNDNNNAAASTVPLPVAASNDDTAPLLLLQLPKGWTTHDLKDSKFIGSSADSSQVVLVVESKKTSFSINRLETSNCLVMVPPPQYDADEQGASKKSKLTATGKTILPVPARLLTPGGSGSSFLELREKPLLIHELNKSLQEHVLNPYNIHINPYSNSNNNSDNSSNTNIKNSSTALCAGRTVYDLAVHLQSSQAQVQSGLEAIQAFCLPRTDPVAYCVLSEETLLVACNAIVSALSEADECQDYAVAGVSMKRLVEHVIQNMSAEELYVDAEFVVRHCLSTLTAAAANSVDGEDNIRLSVGKVRIRIYSHSLRMSDCFVASF